MNAGAGFAALVERIDALLPQTQCRRCGFDACRPYAQALARGESAPNRCPPGGERTAAALAGLIGRDAVPLDPACGDEGPRRVAVIDETWCIGCVICIRACPVDAISGAAKRMHAVLESECTGCELCVAPCPVDCISMLAARVGPASSEAWLAERAPRARRRFEAREARRVRASRPPARTRVGPDRTTRRAEIAAAVARVRARRALALTPGAAPHHRDE